MKLKLNLTWIGWKISFYATEIKNMVLCKLNKKFFKKQILFKEAFQLLVDGTKPDVLQPLMELKLEHMKKTYNNDFNIWKYWVNSRCKGEWLVHFVGLVAMLANLSDPAAVGPAMAVALFTTMYGALLGTLFAGIVESKLSQKHNVEVTACEVIIQGATMIAAEESIGNIKMQLNSILVEG